MVYLNTLLCHVVEVSGIIKAISRGGDMSTKGDWARPDQTTREEQDLRYLYRVGEISLATFNIRYKKLKQDGLITRSGKVVT